MSLSNVIDMSMDLSSFDSIIPTTDSIKQYYGGHYITINIEH